MAGGVELATAYVSLVVSGKGISQGVARELSGVEGQASQTGTKAGQKMGGNLSKAFAPGLKKVGDGMRSLRGPALVGLGAFALGAKGAIDAASDLNEEISKGQQIFGKQASAIEAFADTAATSLGQSKQQALAAASTFGIIAQGAGLSGKAATDFSKQFTTLASDLASFNNSTPQEAIDAIGAAMRGEAEPIRRFGVMLDDATLKAQAMKLGLIDNVKQALTPQQKALAASQAIMAQTGKAQGDFARTSQGAANQQRIMAAKTEDLKAKLGQQLLPVYIQLQSALSKTLDWMSRHESTVKKVAIVVVGLAAAVIAVNAAMSVATAVTAAWNGVTAASAAVQRAATAASLGTRIGLAALAVQTAVTSAVTKAAAAAQWLLNAAMSANPITLVVIAIAALVAAFVLAWKNSETFRAIVTGAWNAIKAATVAVFNFIKGFITLVWNGIKAYFTTVFAIYRTIFTTAWNVIKTVVGGAVNGIKAVITRVFSAVRATISTIFNGIKAVIGGIWRGITSIVTGGATAIYNAVKSIPGKIGGLASSFGSVGKKLIDAFVNGLKGAGNLVSDIAGNIWNAVKGLLNNGIDKLNGALEFKISVLGKSVGINPPDIPHLATGGRAYGGTLAVIGEGREPETVMPDSVMGGFLERMTAAAVANSGGSGRTLLVVEDGRAFRAYVQDIADGVVGAAEQHSGQLGRMGSR